LGGRNYTVKICDWGHLFAKENKRIYADGAAYGANLERMTCLKLTTKTKKDA
jgi:hypothetical protein